MLGAAAVAALALGGTVAAAEPSPQQALPPAPVDCNQVSMHDSVYWRCSVKASGVVNVDDLPGDVHGKPVIIDARGTRGASNVESRGGRAGGLGGMARTAVDGSELEDFYVYVEHQHPRELSMRGGSAAVMSKVPIEDVGGLDDVYLIGGGGGAQGPSSLMPPWLQYCGGGSGGRGGLADAALEDIDAPGVTPEAVTAQGASGGVGNKSGLCEDHSRNPGQGGVDGIGGLQPGDTRKSGKDGIGGIGGGGAGWYDRNGNQVAIGYFGGEGGSSNNSWPKGGGGHGGGGGGEDVAGAGGGGSYAAAPTASAGAFANEPLTPQEVPQVVLFYEAEGAQSVTA